MLPPDRRESLLALAVRIPDIDIEPGSVVLTDHAVRRYRERVEGVRYSTAIRRIRHLLTTAEWQHRPRAWTRVVLHPDVIYGYSLDRPDVCLLLRKQALVTVLSRRFLAQAVPSPRASRSG